MTDTLREAAQMALDAMLNFPDDISDDMFESIKALRAALAQPEQEELGEIVPADEEQLERIAKLVKPEPQGGYRWREGDVPPSMTYTAPPQREWKGLTDEERQECLYSDPIFGMAASTFARAIEAKLKEKNA
jgi:hypothetical protein